MNENYQDESFVFWEFQATREGRVNEEEDNGVEAK